MPGIEFEIDTETGKCETEIKGIQGAACEKTTEQLRKLLGAPVVDRKTAAYRAQSQTKQQIKG
jgi:hypothetical protein